MLQIVLPDWLLCLYIIHARYLYSDALKLWLHIRVLVEILFYRFKYFILQCRLFRFLFALTDCIIELTLFKFLLRVCVLI